MRILCDACENAAAILFCAADEAALCSSCDEKVHMCNKLASRHVRVGLADPSSAPRCDICENAPAFFFCEIDGSSLCLQCDMVVHVGGKRTHRRYLLLRQRIEFPGDSKAGGRVPELDLQPRHSNREPNQSMKLKARDSQPNQRSSPVPVHDTNLRDGGFDSKLIDLNARPQRAHEHTSANQEQGIDENSMNNHEPAGVVPVGSFKRDSEK